MFTADFATTPTTRDNCFRVISRRVSLHRVSPSELQLLSSLPYFQRHLCISLCLSECVLPRVSLLPCIRYSISLETENPSRYTISIFQACCNLTCVLFFRFSGSNGFERSLVYLVSSMVSFVPGCIMQRE